VFLQILGMVLQIIEKPLSRKPKVPCILDNRSHKQRWIFQSWFNLYQANFCISHSLHTALSEKMNFTTLLTSTPSTNIECLHICSFVKIFNFWLLHHPTPNQRSEMHDINVIIFPTVSRDCNISTKLSKTKYHKKL
jgi:hypothetical protein